MQIGRDFSQHLWLPLYLSPHHHKLQQSCTRDCCTHFGSLVMVSGSKISSNNINKIIINSINNNNNKTPWATKPMSAKSEQSAMKLLLLTLLYVPVFI